MLKHENKHYKKVVLAYSGGLDTSTIVPWLKENYGDCEVICFVADVGQEREDLEGIEQKAKQSGASKCIVKDLREEFVKDYVFEAMKTGAIYEGVEKPRWKVTTKIKHNDHVSTAAKI